MNDWSPVDEAMMDRALELAALAKGHTKPNPAVGCVILSSDGRIIGEGYHKKAGEPHAEANALQDAEARGESTVGATAYVTLEPCNHYGRTPPCSLALIRAGIRCAVIAVPDPNPKAVGGAVALREAGIDVRVGCRRTEASLLNADFLTSHLLKRPLVTLKWAMTIDGATATPSGNSQWVTGENARAEVHRHRAEHDAILVGAGTIQSDNPALTVRPPAEQRFPLLRVILDRGLRCSLDATVFSVSTLAPTLVVCTDSSPEEKRRALRDKGVSVEVLPDDVPCLPRATAAILHERGIQSLYVEGGRRVAGAFLDAGLADRVNCWIGAKLLGASGGNQSPIERDRVPAFMNDALAVRHLTVEAYPPDVLLRGWLTDHLFASEGA